MVRVQYVLDTWKTVRKDVAGAVREFPAEAFERLGYNLAIHGQKSYNTPPGRLEDDPAYKLHPRDWEQYHTRYIAPDGFQNALRPGK